MFEFLPLPDPYTRTDADAFVTRYGDEGRADGTGIGSAVIETSTGRLVGSAALRFPAVRGSTAATIGYWVAAAGRGNGYSAEASRVLTHWAFAHGIARVEIRCATGNVASAKSALAAGFRFEGVLRGEGAMPGSAAPVDHAVFGRLPADSGDPVAPSAVPPPPGSASDGVVELRPLAPADRSAVAELEADPGTLRWALATGPLTTAEYAARVSAEAALHWLVGPELRFAIADVSTGRCAGTLSAAPNRPAAGGASRLRGTSGLPRPRLHRACAATAPGLGVRRGGLRPTRAGRPRGERCLTEGGTRRRLRTRRGAPPATTHARRHVQRRGPFRRREPPLPVTTAFAAEWWGGGWISRRGG